MAATRLDVAAVVTEQGDVETIRKALAAKSQSVLAREEQFAALDQLAADLERVERERDSKVKQISELVRTARFEQKRVYKAEDRAEKAERALAEMQEALRKLNVTQMDDHDAALVRAALRSEDTSDES